MESLLGTGALRGKRSGLSIGSHVVMGVGALFVLVAATTAIAMLLIMRLGNDSERLGDRDVPYVSALGAAALSAKGAANDERGFLMTGDQAFATEAVSRIAEARAAFAVAKRSTTDPVQLRAAEEARVGFERWVRALRQEFASYRVGEQRSSVDAALGPHREIRKGYERTLAHAQALGQQAVANATTSVDRATEYAVAILLACVLGVAALGLAIAVWLVRAILTPVHLLLAVLSEPVGQ